MVLTEPDLLYDGAVITILESHIIIVAIYSGSQLNIKRILWITLVPRSLKHFFVRRFPEVLGSSKVQKYCSVCRTICTNGCNAASCKFLMVPLETRSSGSFRVRKLFCHKSFPNLTIHLIHVIAPSWLWRCGINLYQGYCTMVLCISVTEWRWSHTTSLYNWMQTVCHISIFKMANLDDSEWITTKRKV